MRLTLLAAGLLVSIVAPAQTVMGQAFGLRIAPTADGTVYVYHTRPLSLGYGVNVYRDDVLLNDMPVTGAQQGSELAVALDSVYTTVTQALGTTRPAETLVHLRTNRTDGQLLAYLYPSVAQAIGQLYVDTTATLGERATYRVEYVRADGVALGETAEQTLVLTPRQVAAPTDLQVEVGEQLTTLRWQYAQTSEEADDQVIAFRVYADEGDVRTQISAEPVVRNNATTSFSFAHPFLAQGQTVTFSVEAYTIAGTPSPPARETVVLPDTYPPAAPYEISASMVNGVAEVAWPISVEPDAIGYHVYRATTLLTDEVPERLTDAPLPLMESVYGDDTVAPRRQYFYSVSVVDEAGNESERSNAASVQVYDEVAPPAPTSVEATAEPEGVRLSWVAERPADFLTFLIVRRASGEQRFRQIKTDAITASEFVDGARLASSALTYGVMVVDSTRNISDTTFVEVTLVDSEPPTPATQIQALNRDGLRVMVRWNGSTSLDVEGYRLYRASSTDEDPVVVAETPASQKAYEDEAVRPGTTYTYFVTALDAADNESEALPSTPLLFKDFTPPAQVRGVQVNLDGDNVQLQWEAVRSSDLAAYRVYTSSSATGQVEALDVDVPVGTTISVSQRQVEGWVRIAAVDTSGNEGRLSRAVRVR